MKFLLFALTNTLALVPLSALAAWRPGQPLVPCGIKGSGIDCGWEHLVILLGNLIDLGIYVVLVGSAILFAYAGFLYVTAAAKPGQVAQAHKIFVNVVIGLIISLAAWLIVEVIVNTLAPGFVRLG